MNMMEMLGVMVACYFITLTILCLCYKSSTINIANTIFILVDTVFFFAWNYAAYQLGWLEDGFMTLENISPFIMTLIAFAPLLKKEVREYCSAAIAFLWVGMFVAMMVSPEHSYIFNYNHDATFIYTAEAACHLIASLYGIYLILSGQVVCDFKHWLKSVICMYSVITFGVILNLLFHLDNFGMDPYGNYSIYMIDIFGSFGATLAAYYLGVLVVLTVGMQLGAWFNKLVKRVHTEFEAHAKKEAEEKKDDNFEIA